MKSIFVTTLMTTLLLPQLTIGGEVTVRNIISSTSNSGENFAESGEVIEGKSTSHIYVETIVDGEVAESIEETREGNTEVLVEVNNHNSSSENIIQVDTSVSEISMDEVVKDEITKDDNVNMLVVENSFNVLTFIYNLFNHVFAFLKF